MAFRKSKKEPMTDSSSNLNLNLYEPVSIINYQKRKCNRFLQKRAASRPGFRGFGPLILLSPRLRGKGGAVRHQRGPVQRVQKVMVGAFLDTPCGREGSEGSTGKVDGAPPRGFLRFLSLTGPLGLRVVVGVNKFYL